MRTSLALAGLLAAVAFVSFTATPAAAGPVWQVTLSGNDAGSTQTAQIAAKSCYCVQPTLDATCIHLDTWDGGNIAADCTKDLHIPTTQVDYARGARYCFDTAARTAISARSVDGGTNTTVQLYKQEFNPSASSLNASSACTYGNTQ